MTGLPPFLIESTAQFERTFKKLAKSQQPKFVDILTSILETLANNPYPQQARSEPLPSRLKLPENWTFHKLEIRMGKGASGQVRLMYLVNETERIIKLLWIYYTHEQFAKRPPDKELNRIIHEILEQ